MGDEDGLRPPLSTFYCPEGVSVLINAGVWAGIFLLVYCGIMFFQSLSLDYANQLGPGPGFMPLWLSGIFTVIVLMYIGESVKNGAISISEIFPRGSALRDILWMIGGLCVFALVVEYIGFSAAGSMLVFVMTMHKYKWYYALPASIAVSAFVLFIFQTLLGVPLPVNEFGW